MRANIMSQGIEFWAVMEFGYAPKATDSEKEAEQDFVANQKGHECNLKWTV